MLRRLVQRTSEFFRPARPRSLRIESFGAIVQLVRPRALVFVDRDYARGLGVGESPRWQEPTSDGQVGKSVLSAPLEAHLQLTNHCDVGCKGCYTGASPSVSSAEWGAQKWKDAIDRLAEMGVFHLALGGGESATLPWLGEVAEHARERGLVPNLTTSGLYGLDTLLEIAHLFGQINVSIDGLGETYRRVRGVDGFARADDAVCRLRAVKREIGINVVVTRHNFDELGQLFAYARRRRLSDVELLRFKPSGRGIASYSDGVCTDEQHRALLPTVLDGARRHRIRVRVDCSYTPMLAHHNPGRELLASLAVYGCAGGDFLIGAKATGQVTACSFASPAPGHPKLDAIADYWDREDAFGDFRTWRDCEEPCRSCEYNDLCRGGCKVVSRHVSGDQREPDPECPRVVDWRAARGSRRTRLPVVG